MLLSFPHDSFLSRLLTEKPIDLALCVVSEKSPESLYLLSSISLLKETFQFSLFNIYYVLRAWLNALMYLITQLRKFVISGIDIILYLTMTCICGQYPKREIFRDS